MFVVTGPLEVFTRHRRIQLIIDLCDGGDLYARRPYTELAAGLICKQVLRYRRYINRCADYTVVAVAAVSFQRVCMQLVRIYKQCVNTSSFTVSPRMQKHLQCQWS
jgi:hypothetical protein